MTANYALTVGPGKGNTTVSPQPGVLIQATVVADATGAVATIAPGGYLNVAANTLPYNALTYQYSIVDVPGVVASNNFLSLINPSGSGKTYQWLITYIHRYSTAATSSPNSMCVYQITAASAGTLVATSNISEFTTAGAASTAQVRTGNPTVTRLNSTPLFSAAPLQSTGAGNAAPAEFVIPFEMNMVFLPGEGIVFNTAAGDTDQVWGIQVIWAEY